MAKRLFVTRTQKAAAQLKIKRAATTGQVVTNATRAIADAKPVTGRFVTKAATRRIPESPVVEVSTPR